MTVISTVGGGLVTLGGVAAGYWVGRRGNRRQLVQEDLDFWVQNLQEWSGKFHHLRPMGSEEGTISEEDVTALLGEFYHDVLGLVTARPSPRNSVDDYVQMTLLTAPFAVYDDWPAEQAHLLSKAGTGPARGIVLHQIVIQELLAKLRVWRIDGVPRHLPDTISSHMRARGLTRIPEQ